MSDMEILNQMIRNTAKVSLEESEYGKFFVTLHEPQSPKSTVTIVGIPSDAIVIKVDDFQSPDTIFSGEHGECKRADYVIVADYSGKKRILYIELKTTKSPLNEIIKQLAGAKCFISYCQEIGKTFWGKTNFLRDYQHRFVSIGHTSITKRKMQIDRSKKVHDTPDKLMKISWPHRLQFNQLVGA